MNYNAKAPDWRTVHLKMKIGSLFYESFHLFSVIDGVTTPPALDRASWSLERIRDASRRFVRQLEWAALNDTAGLLSILRVSLPILGCGLRGRV
jgi:hypothetical protein